MKGKLMMKALGFMVGGSLYPLYGLFLLQMYQHLQFATAISGVVFAAGAFRFLLYLASPLVRSMRLLILFNIFSIEVFAIPVLAFVYLTTYNRLLLTASIQVFLTWPVSLSVFFLPIAIIRLSKAFSTGASYLLLYPLTLSILSYLALLTFSAHLLPVGSGVSALTLNLLTLLFSYHGFAIFPEFSAISIASLCITTFVLLTYPAARGSPQDDVGLGGPLTLLSGSVLALGVIFSGQSGAVSLAVASSFLVIFVLLVLTRK
ncbi:MAG: hypothetical protein QXV32_03125 [Conexivisphaerales archaeon]